MENINATEEWFDANDYIECDGGCELWMGPDDTIYWDHTEGENGLAFHSEECATDYTISQAELRGGRV